MLIIPKLVEMIDILLSSKRISLKLLHHFLGHRYAFFFIISVYHEKQDSLLEQVYVWYVIVYVLVIEYIATSGIIYQLTILLDLNLQLINSGFHYLVL